jgi:hypothetical protein
VKDKEGKRANYPRDRERECVRERERTYKRKRWRGYKDQDILINTQQKCNMIIRMHDVRNVNVSIRQIVTTVFLIGDI